MAGKLIGAIDRHRVVLPIVWLIIAAALLRCFDRGWIPQDDGTLAHSAERVLAGELPHRDFDGLYTGGLTFLHAGVFYVLGERIISLRWLLLVFTLVFVPAVYALAARFARPLGAGLVTLICIAWSVPHWFSSMPSWYNLFFATFGAVCLFRHVERGGNTWLFLAGLCGGLSCLIKSIGLFYIAAALLFLVHREQTLAEAQLRPGRPRGYPLFTAGGLLAFCVVLGWFLFGLPEKLAGPSAIILFAIPGWALSLVLLQGEWRLRHLDGGPRWRRIVTTGGCFLVGVAIPIGLFLIAYAVTGSLADLYHGVFVLPRRRFELESLSALLRPAWMLAAGLPMLALLCAPLLPARLRTERFITVLLAVGGVAALFLGANLIVQVGVWSAAQALVPTVVVVGALMVALRHGAWADAAIRQQAFLLLALAALLSLVQIPLPYRIYYYYTAPAVALAVLAVMRGQPRSPVAWQLIVAGFCLCFGVWRLYPAYAYAIGSGWTPRAKLAVPDLPPAGVRIREGSARVYEELVDFVKRHSADGACIYAANDAPHVYFLTDRANPTRTLFDLFDEDWQAPDRAARIGRLLDENGVTVAVVNLRHEFSGELPEDVANEIAARFPNQRLVGDPDRTDLPRFLVFWRQPDAPAAVAAGDDHLHASSVTEFAHPGLAADGEDGAAPRKARAAGKKTVLRTQNRRQRSVERPRRNAQVRDGVPGNRLPPQNRRQPPRDDSGKQRP